jgi:hypothetical protein
MRTVPVQYPCSHGFSAVNYSHPSIELSLNFGVERSYRSWTCDFARLNAVRQCWLPAGLFPVNSMPGGCTAASLNYGGMYVKAPLKF